MRCLKLQWTLENYSQTCLFVICHSLVNLTKSNPHSLSSFSMIGILAWFLFNLQLRLHMVKEIPIDDFLSHTNLSFNWHPECIPNTNYLIFTYTSSTCDETFYQGSLAVFPNWGQYSICISNLRFTLVSDHPVKIVQ